MCGIAGLLRRRGDDAEALLDLFLASLERRGPDGEGRQVEGSLALGMRRLAIVDVEHGQQPFVSEDGAATAFLNGEIYNFRALRSELEAHSVRFRTQCDAEVLPHGYRHWGIDGLLQRIDGMFALAIHDRERGVLHLARDRFGEKPLFYVDEPSIFAFASQLTTLSLIPELDLEIDPVALRHYLALHYVPGPRTILRSVRRVLPGHRLELPLEDGGNASTMPWCEPALDTPLPRRYEEAVPLLRDLVLEATRSRLLADVPVGIFLSGGLDSSALAAAATRVGAARVQTFSIGFDDVALDESEHARAVASHLGTTHHHFGFDLEACLGVLDPAISALDEPLGDPACLPVYLLSREARKHATVVLSGEGADELFAGYGYYPRLADCTHAASGPGLAALFRSDNTTPSGFPMLTSVPDRDRFVRERAGDDDAWTEALAARLGREPCPLRRAQHTDVSTWLADDLLPKLDHMTMAVSLEGRAPYLDPRVAALGLAAPAEWKLDPEGGSKRLLRDAVSPWLPRAIFERPKQGFVLPMQAWLQGPLRERLLDGLADEHEDGLHAHALRTLAEKELASGAARSRLLYAVLAYREWGAALRERRTLAHRLAALHPAPRAIERAPQANHRE